MLEISTRLPTAEEGGREYGSWNCKQHARMEIMFTDDSFSLHEHVSLQFPYIVK